MMQQTHTNPARRHGRLGDARRGDRSGRNRCADTIPELPDHGEHRGLDRPGQRRRQPVRRGARADATSGRCTAETSWSATSTTAPTSRAPDHDRADQPTGRASRSLRSPAPPARPCPGGVGLTTALIVLPGAGWSWAACPPRTARRPPRRPAACSCSTAAAGSARRSPAGGINGPWDMTAATTATSRPVRHQRAQRHRGRQGGTVCGGTVLRIGVASRSGLPGPRSSPRSAPASPRNRPGRAGHGTDRGRPRPAALYVADTAANRIAAIPDALDRSLSAGPA